MMNLNKEMHEVLGFQVVFSHLFLKVPIKNRSHIKTGKNTFQTQRNQKQLFLQLHFGGCNVKERNFCSVWS